MPIVVFNPTDFRVIYPEFGNAAKWSDARLNEAFNQATLILDNTESSPVPYAPATGVTERATLLNLLSCHICAIWERGTVGAISSATEGSISSSFAVPQIKNAEWFTQTPCGFAFWQATLKYRMGGMTFKSRNTHSGF